MCCQTDVLRSIGASMMEDPPLAESELATLCMRGRNSVAENPSSISGFVETNGAENIDAETFRASREFAVLAPCAESALGGRSPASACVARTTLQSTNVNRTFSRMMLQRLAAPPALAALTRPIADMAE
jgi:hypothetical protein